MDKRTIGLICIVLIGVYCIIGIGIFYQPYSILTDSSWDTEYDGSSDWSSISSMDYSDSISIIDDDAFNFIWFVVFVVVILMIVEISIYVRKNKKKLPEMTEE